MLRKLGSPTPWGVALALLLALAGPARADAVAPPEPRPAAPGPAPQKLAGIVSASSGLGLLVLGGVFFGLAFDRAAQIEDDPGSCALSGRIPRHCEDPADAARLGALVDEGRAFEAAGWTMFGLGAAGVVAGTILIVAAPDGMLGRSLAARITLGGATARLTVSF